MLAIHGMIVCSMRGLLTLQKCMFESYFKNIICDIYTAQIQPYLNIYSLKKPLVYQYGKIGGQESPTKIDLLMQFQQLLYLENFFNVLPERYYIS